MSVHEKILKWLENGLFEGTLRLGQDLPDDRRIAALIGSSNSSTREALKTLETMGLVRLYEGKRKTIITHLVSSPLASAGSAIRLQMADARHPLRDAVEAQILLETWAVTRENPPQSAIENLESIAEAMHDPAVLPQNFHALEVDFHIGITKLSGNHMVTALMATMHDTLLESKIEMLGRVPLWSTFATRAHAEYQAILGAVKSGDHELAAKLIMENITGQYEEADLNLDEETMLANALPGTQKPAVYFEPVEIDAEDLIPDEWDESNSEEEADDTAVLAEEEADGEQPPAEEEHQEAETEIVEEEALPEEKLVVPAEPPKPEPVSFDLLNALQNVQPVGASTTVLAGADNEMTEDSAPEQELDTLTSTPNESAEPEFSDEPVAKSIELPVQPAASVMPVDEDEKETIVRAPGSRQRRLRGKVTTPVHATVIQPRSAASAQAVVASGILKSEEELTSRTVPSGNTSGAQESAQGNIIRAVPRSQNIQHSASKPATAPEKQKSVQAQETKPAKSESGKKNRSLLSRLFGVEDVAPRQVSDSRTEETEVRKNSQPAPEKNAVAVENSAENQKTRAQLRAEAKKAAAERKAAAKAEAKRRKEEERAEIERLAAEQLNQQETVEENNGLPEGYEVYDGESKEAVYEDDTQVEATEAEPESEDNLSAPPVEEAKEEAESEEPVVQKEKASGTGNALNKNKKKKKKKRR